MVSHLLGHKAPHHLPASAMRPIGAPPRANSAVAALHRLITLRHDGGRLARPPFGRAPDELEPATRPRMTPAQPPIARRRPTVAPEVFTTSPDSVLLLPSSMVGGRRRRFHIATTLRTRRASRQTSIAP